MSPRFARCPAANDPLRGHLNTTARRNCTDRFAGSSTLKFSRTAAHFLSLVLVLACNDSSAQAGIVLETSARATTNSGGTVTEIGSASSQARSRTVLALGEATATATGGSVSASSQGGAIVYVDEEGGGTTTNSASGFASARFVIDDLIFSSQDSAMSTVSTSLGLSLSGGGLAVSGNAHEMKGSHSTVASLAEISLSGAIFSASTGTQLQFSGFKRLELTANSNRDPVTAKVVTSFGILDDIDLDPLAIPENLRTDAFNVALNVPLKFSLSVQVQGSTSTNGVDALGSGVADFGHTLSFATTGPVFDLPDGVTVNSVQGQIVDNQWVGGSSAVPEPSAFFLWATGLLGITGCRWRSRRS